MKLKTKKLIGFVVVVKLILIAMALYDSIQMAHKAETVAGSVTVLSYFVFLAKDLLKTEVI